MTWYWILIIVIISVLYILLLLSVYCLCKCSSIITKKEDDLLEEIRNLNIKKDNINNKED